MPFIQENITSRLGAQHRTDVINTFTEFEREIGAPVRIMQAGDSRTLSRSLQAWSGESANMKHYLDAFTPEQRDSTGITIHLASWNSEVNDAPGGFRYVYLHEGLYKEWSRARSTVEFEVEAPDFSEDDILAAGGVPLIARNNGWDNGWEAREDEIYGEVYERVAFLYFNLKQYTDWGRANYQELFLDALIENASEELREAARIRREAEQREVFTRMMEDQGNVQLVELRNKSADIARTRAEAEVTLTNAKIDAEQLALQLHYLIEQQGELSSEEIQSEWDAIRNHASVKTFTLGKSGGDSEELTERERRRRENRGEDSTGLTSSWLKLQTELLWIEHPRSGRKIPLGEFDIKLNFGVNTLEIKNRTNPQGRWDHPHVENGRLCAADYASTITELLRKRKLAGMTGMVFSILKTLTMDDMTAVNNMKLWEENDDRVRRENGWPDWAEGEGEHPLLAADNAGEEADSDG